jgi:hypothetical protein
VETLLENKIQSPVKIVKDANTRAPERHSEIDELLRIKRGRRIDGARVPCPACGVAVEIAINRCPFCESDITAETALARETTRRLRELSGELDAEHAEHTKKPPTRRGFFQRLKYLFEGDLEPVAPPRADPYARRLLSQIAPGDTLKVLDEDGPWLQVKTMSSVIGWVYSTVRKDP